MTDNVETMAFVGETPWHGLGTRVTADITTEDMLVAAGLDWTVSKRPLQYQMADKKWKKVPGKYMLTRDDSEAAFPYLVTDKYKEIQNTAILDFFREYVTEGGMSLHTAGSLKGGRHIWCLAEINESFNVGLEDTVSGFVLLSQSHQVGYPLIMQMTGIRVVCWNTLTAAIGGSLRGDKGNSGQFRMSHSLHFDDAMKQQAKEVVGLAKAQFHEFNEAAQVLSKAPAKADDVLEYFQTIFGGNLKDDGEVRSGGRLDKLQQALVSGPGATLDGSDGTWWGAFNAVTYCVDHEFGSSADTKLEKAWLGIGVDYKQQALNLALNAATPKAPRKSKVKVPVVADNTQPELAIAK